MDGTMRERIARKLCELDGVDPDADFRSLGPVFLTVEVQHPEAWRTYLSKADAVLDAMREPTEEMLAAGALAPMMGEDHRLEDQVWSAYTAMIDAARTPAKES